MSQKTAVIIELLLSWIDDYQSYLMAFLRYLYWCVSVSGFLLIEY